MLDTEPSKYALDYEVTRYPNNQLSISLSRKGKTPDRESVKDSVIQVLSSRTCEMAVKKKVPLLTVISFLGAESISSLINQPVIIAPIQKKNSEQEYEEEIFDKEELSQEESWRVTDSISPIDDSVSIMMSKKAKLGEQSLVVRCHENKTLAYIATQDFLGRDNTSATIRFDKELASKQTFLLSTNRKALFFNSAISNIKKMMSSEQVVVRYQTSRGASKTVTFNLGGLNESIGTLREACKW